MDEMEPSNLTAPPIWKLCFKPSTMLSSLDEGVNAVTGNVLRLEGHTQNEAMYSESSQSLLISTFGKLKPSLLFQFVIPLCLIFFAFNTYTSERESGRLKLLLIQGAGLWRIVVAKALCIWSIGLVLLLLTMSMQIFAAPSSLSTDELLRLGLLGASYAVYYLLLINLTIGASMIARNSTSALAFPIALWALWTIFLPKIIGNAVEQLHPLPTRVEFKAEMSADRAKGIDGHRPSDVRRKELEQATLAKYNVATLTELPINFAGIVMQADEEYGNQVWDKHFGKLYQQLETQKQSYQRSGVVNPFAALQSLSMGAAGTDMFHHLNFLRQAETYRRYFIKTLNDEYAFGGAKTGERGWKADTAFFQSVRDFTINHPPCPCLSRNMHSICWRCWAGSLRPSWPCLRPHERRPSNDSLTFADRVAALQAPENQDCQPGFCWPVPIPSATGWVCSNDSWIPSPKSRPSNRKSCKSAVWFEQERAGPEEKLDQCPRPLLGSAEHSNDHSQAPFALMPLGIGQAEQYGSTKRSRCGAPPTTRTWSKSCQSRAPGQRHHRLLICGALSAALVADCADLQPRRA